MPIRISNIHLPLDHPEGAPEQAALQWLGVKPDRVIGARIRRRSVDARRGRPLQWVYQVDVDVRGDEAAILNASGPRRRDRKIRADRVPAGRPAPPEPGRETLEGPVVVVGAGPAGLFAAARLAERGYRPLILERGKPTKERMRDLRAFRLFGRLDPESNLLFGEGGAGLFSDGKLTTRNRSPLVDEVIDLFHRAGAPEAIRIEARPHLGSNLLPRVIGRLRVGLEQQGAVFRFGARVVGVERGPDGRIVALRIVESASGIDEERLEVGAVILATGGSARDLFDGLESSGVALEPRPTLIGIRVEHAQALVDRNQYGDAGAARQLGHADYFLKFRPGTRPDLDRPVHSFCMCPGGEVIAVASEPGGVSANGMSVRSRSSGYANSALIAPVGVEDYPGRDVLSGVAFQRHLERAVFQAGGGDYALPAQALTDFHAGRSSAKLPPGPRVTRRRPADVHRLVPVGVARALRAALEAADRSLPGFLSPEATAYGLEVRTASPVRIVRAESGESTNTPRLYPAGEGAGYAGGIMSAAIDGMEQADRIIHRFARPD